MEFQNEVGLWLLACFGEEVARDQSQRNHRFLEEAIELVQSLNCTRSEAHQLVDYVFDRPTGEPMQEVGGVMVTLAGLGWANAMPVTMLGALELARVWQNIERIRQKQARKPAHSPLPGASA
jgi:hypothetical protein